MARAFAGLALTGYWALLMLLTFEARADLHELTFSNTDTEAVTGIEVCIGPECTDFSADCGPGADCPVVVDIPDGCHAIQLRTHRGGDRSENVVDRTYCVIDELTRYDRDANGAVTTEDFRPFWDAFRAY